MRKRPARGRFWPRWYSAFSGLFTVCTGEVLLLRGNLPVWLCLVIIFLGLCSVQAVLRRDT
jgi:hypothetical protein